MGLGWTRLGGVGEWTRVLMRMRMVMRRIEMVVMIRRRVMIRIIIWNGSAALGAGGRMDQSPEE